MSRSHVPATMNRKMGLIVATVVAGTTASRVGAQCYTLGGPSAWYVAASAADGLATGDVDGNGAADIIIAGGGGVAIWLGVGDGTFLPGPPPQTGGTGRVVVADLDDNGAVDLVVTRPVMGDMAVLVGAGDGTFGPPFSLATSPATDLRVVDVDDDGNLDIMGATVPDGVVVFLGRGDGTFQAGNVSGVGRWGGLAVAAGQFDAGALDVVVASTEFAAYVMLGDGTGHFTLRTYIDLPDFGSSVATADLDDDGNGDVAIGTDVGVVVALGNGNGTFQNEVLYAAAGSRHIGIADLNGDRIDDIVGAGPDGDVSVLLGVGDGTFATPLSVAFGSQLSSIAIDDLDNNGSRDLVAADIVLEAAGVALSTGPGIAPPTLPDGYVGSAYSVTLVASGGAGPATFSLAAGALPSGLALSPFGSISGVPAAIGDYAFTVGTDDGQGCGTSRDYTMLITSTGCGTVSIVPDHLPRAHQWASYASALTAAGDAGPFEFAIEVGALPAGLVLSTAGLVSGIPVQAGRFELRISATSSNACFGVADIVIFVEAVPLREGRYLVGQGPGLGNANRVRLFDLAGTASTVDFLAYAAGSYGTRVASGEILGDGHGQILTGPGPGPVLGPHLRSFRFDGTAIAKVSFFAYGTLKFGVNPGSSDVDGDYVDEILTGAGPGPPFGAHVRGWNYDGVVLQPIGGLSYFAYATPKYGVNVAGSGLLATTTEQILTAPGPGPVFGDVVRGWAWNGATVTPVPGTTFSPFGMNYGAVVASGDVDGDGFEEVLTAPGPGPMNPSLLRGFNFDGVSISAISGLQATPYPSSYGTRLASADFDVDGMPDVGAGPGPDPAAVAAVIGWRFESGALMQLPGTPFSAFPGQYGVDVAGGPLAP